MNKFAVIGNPIEHSLSPVIWQAFAKSLNIQLDYQKILATPESFVQDAQDFFAAGGAAMNVTAPFKSMAYQLANEQTVHTLDCKTGNFLVKQPQGIQLNNTDGLGLIADIQRNQISLHNKRILFIGNGSVIHSVLSAIEHERPLCIDMLMRNYANIIDFKLRSHLVGEFKPSVSYDVVINTTPNSATNSLFSQIKLLANEVLVYDMIYTQPKTLFMQEMLKINSSALAINGIGMLIQQAKIAFIQIYNQQPVVDELYALFKELYK